MITPKQGVAQLDLRTLIHQDFALASVTYGFVRRQIRG